MKQQIHYLKLNSTDKISKLEKQHTLKHVQTPPQTQRNKQIAQAIIKTLQNRHFTIKNQNPVHYSTIQNQIIQHQVFNCINQTSINEENLEQLKNSANRDEQYTKTETSE